MFHNGNLFYLIGISDFAAFEYISKSLIKKGDIKAIELEPNYFLAYNERGRTYSNLGQYERTIQDFDKAIELNPNESLVYNNRGLAYVRLKKYEQSIQDFNKAVELNPNDAEAYNNRGVSYMNGLKQFAQAIKDFDDAIVLDPDYTLARKNRRIAINQFNKNVEIKLDFDPKEFGWGKIILIEKTFIGESGMLLTLHSMNRRDPEDFAKSFFKTGFQENDNFIVQDDGNYRGTNFVWQVMMNATKEDIRRYFKTSFINRVDSFRDDYRGTWKWGSTAAKSNMIKVNMIEIARRDIVAFLEKGIEMELNGYRGKIGTRDGIYHFVGMDWFKQAYIQCYNEDNGIKEGCFITTAVCNNLGKSDDCFELMTFRNFRDTWLISQPDGQNLIDEYYNIAPRIVDNINRLSNATQIYQSIWQKYLEPCLNFIKHGDNLSCKRKYVEMIQKLKIYF